MIDDGAPLDPGESEAFDELTEGLDVEMPPSEAEAREYLGDAAYEKMSAHNDAANDLALLMNHSAVVLTHSKARMWRAMAGTMWLGGIVGTVWAIKRMFD